MTTTEVPTFFGPRDSPLFGVLHLPTDNRIRGGVLICGSLGKEAIDSARLHRRLGESLAGRGFAVLRFDYLGTGDSAFAQMRDDAVDNWVASVGHALDYLTLIGAESLSAIGIRAGCLILQDYLGESRNLGQVVYLDPAGTGRRYLREHTALFRVSLGDDASPPGEVSVIGGRFSPLAAAALSALKVGAEPVSDRMLLVGRPGETERHLTALASARGVDSIVAHGLPESARPRDVLLPVPIAAVDAIVEWVDRQAPTRIHRATPEYKTTTTMPAEGPDGTEVVESIERVGLHGIFAIRARPRRSHLPDKTVLFFVGAKDLHVGPAREWVELSRRIASTGSQAVRWDPAGLGLSAHIDRDPFRSVYLKGDIADSVAVARRACRDASQLELVGLCSGAWYAAHTARITGARSAILINQLAWSWRVAPTVLSQWYHRKRALEASAAIGTADNTDESVSATDESRVNRIKARLGPAREKARSVLHEHFPRWLLRLLAWVGLVWLPEVVLTTLARRGTDVTMIVSPEDEQLVAARGGCAAVDRLQAMPHPPRMVITPVGDHSANHPAILAAIRDAVLPIPVSSAPKRMPRLASTGRH